MSLITGLFNILALLYIGRAVQLAFQLLRNWSVVRQEPLTREKQRLAEQAAFFLGVPPAVMVHELAHALAIVAFGGRVGEFGYRVFWGYVVPVGTFTAVQEWVIAITGTIGSLAFGAILWLILRRNSSRTIQYFGLRAFRFQIYFSLVYYPIFTLFLPIGDWRTIYNFSATPLLSGITAAVHAALLFWFWRADRAGAFEMIAFESTGEQAQYAAATAAAAAGDPSIRLRQISYLRNGGANRQARKALDAFLADFPNSAEGQLQLAIMAGGGGQQVNRDAYEAAGRALELGLGGSDQVGLARQIRGLYNLQRGDGPAAEAELSAALTPSATHDPDEIMPIRRAELHNLLSQAYRRQGRYELALVEIDLALKLAREMALEPVIQKYAAEKELIENHARRGKPNTTSDVIGAAKPPRQ